MWAEWVTPETIDSRVWPRTAAIAERLWSPREVRDLPDMYRRLAVVSRRLEEAGLRHESYVDSALRRLAGDDATPADLAALRAFVDLIEPVKDYRRGGQQPNANQATPLTGLVDCARPDSAPARALAAAVDALVLAPAGNAPDAGAVTRLLAGWKSTAASLESGLFMRSPRLQEVAPLVRSLGAAITVGEEAVRALEAGRAPAAGWRQAQFAKLDQAAQPHDAAELPVIGSIKMLVAAATEQEQRGKLSVEAWQQHLLSIVIPPAKSTTP